MSQNKYAARVDKALEAELRPEPLLTETSLTVQSRQGKDCVEWRAVFRQSLKPDVTTPWAERSKFNADYAVIRNKLSEAVGMHYGRPH